MRGDTGGSTDGAALSANEGRSTMGTHGRGERGTRTHRGAGSWGASVIHGVSASDLLKGEKRPLKLTDEDGEVQCPGGDRVD